MRQRIDPDELWRSAREQAMLAYEGAQGLAADLPTAGVLTMDDLLAPRIDSSGLAQRLRNAGTSS